MVKTATPVATAIPNAAHADHAAAAAGATPAAGLSDSTSAKCGWPRKSADWRCAVGNRLEDDDEVADVPRANSSFGQQIQRGAQRTATDAVSAGAPPRRGPIPVGLSDHLAEVARCREVWCQPAIADQEDLPRDTLRSTTRVT